MGEYQVKRLKPYLLPETVYRQALWAVKDLGRLKEARRRALMHIGDVPGADFSEGRVCERGSLARDLTGRQAQAAAMLSMKIEAIESALEMIPEKYRRGIILKLAKGVPYDDSFHINTWKKWQQIYIFYVAKNLGLY